MLGTTRILTPRMGKAILLATRIALRLESTAAATRPALTSCWKCGKHLCGPSPTCQSPAKSKLPPVGKGSHGDPTPAHANSSYQQQQSQPSDAGCGAVQPVAAWATFFDVFALATTRFDVDLGALKQRFLALQQIVHPDANSQRSQKEREFSEKQSVFINKAYQTLRDPLSRAKYMLHLNGIHIDESVKGGMDPSSLMKIMDIWEAIEEVEDQAGLDILMKENEERISTEVQASSKAFEASDLEAARKAVTKLQYWYSLRQRLRDVNF